MKLQARLAECEGTVENLNTKLIMLEKSKSQLQEIYSKQFLYNLFQLKKINKAVFFWYLLKSDLSSAGFSTRVHWTSQFLQGTRNTQPCLTGHPLEK